jgi:DNA topoisomerase II
MSAKGMQKAEEQGFSEFFKLVTRINTSNMICFDFDGKIRKYSSPEEILEEFYNKRLIYYQKRKASLRELLHTRVLTHCDGIGSYGDRTSESIR